MFTSTPGKKPLGTRHVTACLQVVCPILREVDLEDLAVCYL
jgi:hypothetical protein